MDPDAVRERTRQGYREGDHHGHCRSDRNLHDVEARFLDRLPDGRVLDLGCGTGVPFAAALADRGCKVVGVDLVEQHVERARELVADATFIRGTMEDPPVDGRFDAALCLYALVHLHRDRHAAFFAAVAELLRDSGRFLVTVSEEEQVPAEDAFAGGTVAWSAWPPEKTLQLLREAGFSVVDSAPVQDYDGGLDYRMVLAEQS